MNSILFADAASSDGIFCAVCDFVTPISKTRERMLLKEDLLVSSNPCDMNSQSVLLVNGDIPLGIYPHLSQSHPVITYGCNPKATVTASSICENKLMCCVQRPLMPKGFGIVLPQEIPVIHGQHSVSSLLGAICILLLSFGESFFLKKME